MLEGNKKEETKSAGKSEKNGQARSLQENPVRVKVTRKLDANAGVKNKQGLNGIKKDMKKFYQLFHILFPYLYDSQKTVFSLCLNS